MTNSALSINERRMVALNHGQTVQKVFVVCAECGFQSNDVHRHNATDKQIAAKCFPHWQVKGVNRRRKTLCPTCAKKSAPKVGTTSKPIAPVAERQTRRPSKPMPVTTGSNPVRGTKSKRAPATAGPWTAHEYVAPRGCFYVRGKNDKVVVSGPTLKNATDAAIIEQAGTIHHDTGLMPLDVLHQRNALLAFAQNFFATATHVASKGPRAKPTIAQLNKLLDQCANAIIGARW